MKPDRGCDELTANSSSVRLKSGCKTHRPSSSDLSVHSNEIAVQQERDTCNTVSPSIPVCRIEGMHSRTLSG
jgi:hypothetical protein